MAWVDLLADRSARRWLSAIELRLASGWTALAQQEPLRHEFERHLRAVADEVRCEQELVRRPEPVSNLVLLASHAHDVRRAAAESGWRPPATTADWTIGEWTGLRLLACYRLATTLPRGPRPPLTATAVPVRESAAQ
ncbi:DUF6401 family natural product biosynthesis protein [Amycolatopsis anabasis]|uniref:DUF6401 family natural product biosynthesis protein n=1 Tax=Amycolatopsis anabasis TaxID=1840409 RepID=UPI001FE98EDE|nr:DUF6401 family natural product biosynthesis protein [Amycolatopsis anabasis]